ncbi:MAG: hypothetical protein ABI297_01650 [Ginsengibacter sp.]
MNIILRYFLCVFLLAAGANVFAQQTGLVTKVQKFKPPVVKSYLGVNQNGAQVTLTEGMQLIGLPIKVVDATNHAYPIDSYQFLYKEKGMRRNVETGKKETSFSIVSDRFKESPIPKVWINNIKDRLQKDEEIYFFDIVVTDKEGRKFFAPDLKITIK